jgi:hypothetical protein
VNGTDDRDPDGDELAGVVDLFGALTREELQRALRELAFKRGEEADEDAVVDGIEAALEAYALVEVEADDVGVTERPEYDAEAEPYLVPGPTAFPTLPPDAEDLPHIMDAERRTVDREAVGEAVLKRLTKEAARAVDAGDRDRAERLLDASYDLEAWAPVAADQVRTGLDDWLERDAEEP